jgi:hypothetical protein
MELFLRTQGEVEWSRCPAVMDGLKRALDTTAEPLLFCPDPAKEAGDLIAAVWLFRAAGGRPERLAVASPHPSRAWIEPVKAAGVGRFLLLPKQSYWPPRFRIERVVEVPDGICPLLHARGGEGGALSVCGGRGDFVVLVEEHFRTSCFADWASCPSYRTNP